MKCVIMKASGHIIRTTNYNAENLVRNGKAEYTNKSSWRKFIKDLKETVERM